LSAFRFVDVVDNDDDDDDDDDDNDKEDMFNNELVNKSKIKKKKT
jgi:hypothetical protein